MQRLPQVLLIILASTVGIQAVYQRYSALLDNALSMSAGYLNMYYDTATGKVVTGIHVAGPVGAKMIGWVIKSQSFNNPIDNDQVLLPNSTIPAPLRGTTLQGISVSIVLDNTANTTLQGTLGAPVNVDSISGPYYAPLVGSSVTGTSFVSAYLYWRNGQFWLAYAVDSRGSKPNNYNLTLTVLLTRDLLTTKTGTCQVLTTRTSSESLTYSGSAAIDILALAAILEGQARVQFVSRVTGNALYYGLLKSKDYWAVYSAGQVVSSSASAGAVGIGQFSLSEVSVGQYAVDYAVTTGGSFPSGVDMTITFFGPANASQTASTIPPTISGGRSATLTGSWTVASQNTLALLSSGLVYSTVASGSVTRLRTQLPPISLILKGYTHVSYVYDASNANTGSAVVFLRLDNKDWRSYSVLLQGIDYQQVTGIEFSTRIGATPSVIFSTTELTGRFNNSQYLFTTTNDLVTIKTTANPTGISGNIYSSYVAAAPTPPPPTQSIPAMTKAPTTPPPAFGNSYCGLLSGWALSPPVNLGLAGTIRAELKTIASGLGQEHNLYFEMLITWGDSTELVVSLYFDNGTIPTVQPIIAVARYGVISGVFRKLSKETVAQLNAGQVIVNVETISGANILQGGLSVIPDASLCGQMFYALISGYQANRTDTGHACIFDADVDLTGLSVNYVLNCYGVPDLTDVDIQDGEQIVHVADTKRWISGTPLRGTWNAVPQDTLNKLATGQLTVAVGSPAYLKGTIWPTVQSFSGILAGANQVPTAVQNTAAGGFVLGKLLGKSLSYEIYLSGVNSKIIAAHFHGPADAASNAGVMWDIKDALSANGGRDTITLTTQDVVNLYNGMFYLNIHSDKEPAGELRAQVVRDPVSLAATDQNSVELVSALSNGRLTSPNPTGVAGMARLRLQEDNSLEYSVQFFDVQPYGTAVSGLAVYAYNDDDTWSKGFDLDQSQVSQNEARGRIKISPAYVDLLLRNRLFIRLDTGLAPNGAIQGQIFYRWKSFYFPLAGANFKPVVPAQSTGFGYAELDPTGNLYLGGFFTSFSSAVTEIALYDKSKSLRFDMTNRLEDNEVKGFWPNIRGRDLFNLIAYKFYVIIRTVDYPNGELLSWLKPAFSSNERYHFISLIPDGKGGGASFDFFLTQDNKIDYLFFLYLFPSASLVELDYFGEETVQVTKTVGVPNPFAGPNSTVSPTITTETIVPVSRSGWLSVFKTNLPASPVSVQRGRIENATAGALLAFIRNKIRIRVTNSDGDVVSSSYTVTRPFKQSCLLSAGGAQPAQTNGAYGAALFSFGTDGSLLYEVFAQGLNGDNSPTANLLDSSGNIILSTSDFIDDTFAEGVVHDLTLDQFKKIVSGKTRVEVTLETNSIGGTPKIIPFDEVVAGGGHLFAFLSAVGTTPFTSSKPTTGGVGAALAQVSDNGIVQLVVYTENLSSDITSIYLTYYNKTWVPLLRSGLVASQAGVSGVAYVSWKPSNDVIKLLLTKNIYVVVKTSSYSSGEVAGQLSVSSSTFLSVMASFNASSPSANGGVGVITQLDDYGLFHLTAYLRDVRYKPTKVVLTVLKPGWGQSQQLADITSGIRDVDLVIAQTEASLALIYYLRQGWVWLEMYTEIPYATFGPDLVGVLFERESKPTNVRQKLDVGAVLTGTEQKDYPSLVTPGAAGFLFQLDNNSIIRFSLYTARTQTLLNVTIEDDDGNIVAVAVTVFTEESRAVGIGALNDSQVSSLRNGGFIVRAITRGYPLGEIAGSILFQRKTYYGVANLDDATGVGAFHKTVLDIHGSLYFDLQLSGLTGPVAWIALQQDGRNVTMLTDFFENSRARGFIHDLTTEELMVFDTEHRSSYVVSVVGSTNPDLVVDVVKAENRDIYPAHYSAVLSGRQVALADGSNSVVLTSASGIVIVVFDKENNLDYRAFALSSDDPITSLGFYGPAGAGYTGPLLFEIPLGPSPLAHGKWWNPSPAVKRALTNGQIYVLAKSADYPNGLLRGQLVLEPHEFYTLLSSSQELHSVAPNGSAGYGEFFLTPAGYFYYKVVVEGISQVVPAHIHGTAEFFETAHHVHTIDLNQQPDGSLMAAGRWGPLSADEIQGLLNGNYYVNVHTSANPAGELRGHIIALLEEHYNGIPQFQAVLSGASALVRSQGAGYAAFWLTDDNTLYYDVSICGTDVTGLYIRGPSSQSFDLSDSLHGPRAIGALSLANPNDRFSLINGDFSMLTTSRDNPAGELEGQLQFKTQTNVAILNQAEVGRSTQFGKPVSSAGLSIFVFEKDAKFNYRVNYTGLQSIFSSTVKQPNWGDRTLTSPSPRYGRSQLISTVESKNIVYQRTTVGVSSYVPSVETVITGTFRYSPIPEPVESLLYGRPFVDGALALMLDPGSVIPPSTSYLSAGGVLYLSFDEPTNSLHYAAFLAGITGPVTKAEFQDRQTATTLFNILPVIGSDSYNGYKVAASSIILSPTQRAQFANSDVCLYIESSTSSSDQTSVIRGCIGNELVFPPCYDSGRTAWIAENLANTLVTLVNDSFLFPFPKELNYTLLQGKWSWWSNDSLFQDIPVGTGQLSTDRALDYEQQHQHNLTIGMIRKGNNYCNMTVLVNVIDINDNDPYFLPDVQKINGCTIENGTDTDSVWIIYLNDYDSPANGNPKVQIKNQWDANGNEVFNFYVVNDVYDSPEQKSIAYVKSSLPLDYDLPDGAGHNYVLVLEASDAGSPSRSKTQRLELCVRDINDNPPVFDRTDPDYASTLLDETHAINVPFESYPVTDADSGVNAMANYSVIGGAQQGLFYPQPIVGGFQLSLLQPIDHESQKNYLLTIQAVDNGIPAFTSATTVNITVLDIPFRVEIQIPCGFLNNSEDGWFSNTRKVSLTFLSNEEDGVSTVPQFECRFISRPTPAVDPKSPSRVASYSPPCDGRYFQTYPRYGQPGPLSLSSTPFQNCGPKDILRWTESRNLTDGLWEFQVRTKLRNPAKDIDTFWSNSISVTVDTVEPQTMIDRGRLPPDMLLKRRRYITKYRNPAFVYYSNEPKSVFLCRLSFCSYDNFAGSDCDGGWIVGSRDWSNCTTVVSGDPSRSVVKPTDIWVGLEREDGWYLFEVTAIDRAGNRDGTPDSFLWEMDTTKPIVGFQSYPNRATNETTVDILMLKNDLNAVYSCSFNGSIQTCNTDTFSSDLLPDGTAKFTVSATDEAGNVADEIEYLFHVETKAPLISLSNPEQYAFKNRSNAIVYFQTSGIFQDIACRNVRREMTSLLTDCCDEAFNQDKISQHCLSDCRDLTVKDYSTGVRQDEVCRAYEFFYTTCLQRRLKNVPNPDAKPRALFTLNLCPNGAIDMGRSMTKMDVYTLEIRAQDQAGNPPTYIRKSYVYDPRFVTIEQAIADPVKSEKCSSLPTSLTYIILVAVSWSLVALTIVIFLIACKTQRSGPQRPKGARRTGGTPTRMTSLTPRAEAKVDISQFETAAFDDVAPDPLSTSSERIPFGECMEPSGVDDAARDTGE